MKKEIIINGYDKAYVEESGLKVREKEFSVGLGKDALVAAVMTDSHLRTDERVIKSFETTLLAAKAADMLIMLGDNIESSSRIENVERLKSAVFDEWENVICVVGNHEKFYGDEVANRALVDSVWPHDTRYYSVTYKNKVMFIAMDNNEYTFTEEQCESFEKDIAQALENGLKIILLTHVRFDCADKTHAATAKMQSLIYSAGEVMLASFSGHSHRDEFHEYLSVRTMPNGEKSERKFPAFNVNACDSADDGGNILFLRLS